MRRAPKPSRGYAIADGKSPFGQRWRRRPGRENNSVERADGLAVGKPRRYSFNKIDQHFKVDRKVRLLKPRGNVPGFEGYHQLRTAEGPHTRHHGHRTYLGRGQEGFRKRDRHPAALFVDHKNTPLNRPGPGENVPPVRQTLRARNAVHEVRSAAPDGGGRRAGAYRPHDIVGVKSLSSENPIAQCHFHTEAFEFRLPPRDRGQHFGAVRRLRGEAHGAAQAVLGLVEANMVTPQRSHARCFQASRTAADDDHPFRRERGFRIAEFELASGDGIEDAGAGQAAADKPEAALIAGNARADLRLPPRRGRKTRSPTLNLVTAAPVSTILPTPRFPGTEGQWQAESLLAADEVEVVELDRRRLDGNEDLVVGYRSRVDVDEFHHVRRMTVRRILNHFHD